MEIGSEVLWRDRAYILVGLDPMNVPERCAYLRERDGDEVVEAPFDELLQPSDEPGFASQC